MKYKTVKKHVLHFNRSNKNSVYSFLYIKNGSKKVETRAGTEKFRKMKAGEMLVFVCGGKKVERKIYNVRMFKSVYGMLKVYKVKDILPNLSTKKELEAVYDSFTGYKDKIKKFGIIAFEIGKK